MGENSSRWVGGRRLARLYSWWVGVALIVLGLVGLVVPGVPDVARVLGDGLQSAIHLISGVVLLSLAFAGTARGDGVAVRFGAQACGLIYALIGLFGLTGDGTVLGLFPVTFLDNLIHLAVGLLGLHLGFRKTGAPTPR
jgi:hypothetical protein